MMFLKTTGRKWGTITVLGYDINNSLWNWQDGSTYYISTIVGKPITIDGSGLYYPTGYTYNAYDYYIVSDGYLWYDSSDGLVITSCLGSCNTSTYSWWKSLSGLIGIYQKQGTASADKTIAYGAVAGWSRTGTFNGVYTRIGQPDKYVGWLAYSYAFGKYFTEYPPQIYGGKKVFWDNSVDYRVMWWDISISKWVISMSLGLKSETQGYWSCTTAEGTYVRTFTPTGTPPSIPPAPETYVLTSTYLTTTVQYPIYMGQVALWL